MREVDVEKFANKNEANDLKSLENTIPSIHITNVWGNVE